MLKEFNIQELRAHRISAINITLKLLRKHATELLAEIDLLEKEKERHQEMMDRAKTEHA